MAWITTHPWLTVLIVVGFVVAFYVVRAVMLLPAVTRLRRA